jgi:hypothetical protein
MTKRRIDILFEASSNRSHDSVRASVRQCLAANTEACSEAAAVWARLHYGHAAYTDGTLAVQSVDFSATGAGKATMSFDWTFQDGCSDIYREGTGYVEFAFSVADGELRLDWVWPEQPSTADEL